MQAFYRFKRSDCGGVDGAGGGDSRSQAPPLVLLPGLGAAMSSFGPELLRQLSCSREVVLLEHRGAGLSVDYSSEPLTYYTMAGGCWGARWGGDRGCRHMAVAATS